MIVRICILELDGKWSTHVEVGKYYIDSYDIHERGIRYYFNLHPHTICYNPYPESYIDPESCFNLD